MAPNVRRSFTTLQRCINKQIGEQTLCEKLEEYETVKSFDSTSLALRLSFNLPQTFIPTNRRNLTNVEDSKTTP